MYFFLKAPFTNPISGDSYTAIDVFMFIPTAPHVHTGLLV